jgi:arylsulfatase A-like enzyme
MDYVGHATGPDTPQMHDMVLTVDMKIGQLLAAAEEQAGAGNVLVVFTADHGVAPVPEENIQKQLPGGRYNTADEQRVVEEAMAAAFGAGTFIERYVEPGIYLNYAPVEGKTISHGDLERAAAQALRQLPAVYRVYTKTELENGLITGDRIDQRVRNGYSPLHSGDVIVIHQPNWLSGGPGGTTHGSPFTYDSHVPVIFWGPQSLVKQGQYHRDAAVHDIAPTLATMLGISAPSGAMGRVLDGILP